MAYGLPRAHFLGHLGFFSFRSLLEGHSIYREAMDQTEALIWSFMWELHSSLVSLSNYDVFSSLAAPVPKSQKGQSPRPVSGAGLQLQGLLGALSSTLLPPSPGGSASWHWLVWNLQLL